MAKSPVKQRPNKRKTPKGRPWQKGQSGNPKGRPKTGLAAAEIVRAIGAELVGEGKSQMTRLEAVVRRLFQAAILGDPRAAVVIMDRGWGKPLQPIDVSMTWREDLERLGYDPDQLKSEAVEQFAALVASHSAQRAGSPDGGGVARGEA